MGLFSAIGGIVGGLFGGGGSKTQKTESSVDYSKMVKRATAAGFNPLTALRNGGSAGFTTTTSPSVSSLPDVLGNIGGVLGGALDNRLDPIEAKKREVDTVLLDRQLSSLKAGPQLPSRLYAPREYFGTSVSQQLAPRVGPSASTRSASVPATKSGFKSDMGYTQADPPTVTNPYPKGVEPDPNTPDASAIEDRLGDDILSPAFWLTAPRDISHNADKWLSDRGIPLGPTELGAKVRQGFVDLWNKPGTRKSGPGMATKKQVEPRKRAVPKTRVGKYTR